MCFDWPKRTSTFAQYDNKIQRPEKKADLARIGITSSSGLNLNQIPHIPSIFNKYRHAWAWNNRATGVWFPLPASPLGAAEGTKNLHYDSHRWYKSPSSLLFFCLEDPYRHFEVTLVEWQRLGSNWASRYYVNSVIGGFGFACFRAENRQHGNFRSFKSNSFRLSFSSDLVMDI